MENADLASLIGFARQMLDYRQQFLNFLPYLLFKNDMALTSSIERKYQTLPVPGNSY